MWHPLVRPLVAARPRPSVVVVVCPNRHVVVACTYRARDLPAVEQTDRFPLRARTPRIRVFRQDDRVTEDRGEERRAAKKKTRNEIINKKVTRRSAGRRRKTRSLCIYTHTIHSAFTARRLHCSQTTTLQYTGRSFKRSHPIFAPV